MPVALFGGLDLLVRRRAVDVIDQLAGLGRAGLELDAGIQVFGILADDDQIDRHAAKEGANARIILAGADAGVQLEFLAELHVDAAKTLAHRRGDGGLQGTVRAADAGQQRFRQRGAGPFHDIDPRLLRVPGNLHARGVDAHPCRLGQFRTCPITKNQRHIVCHRAKPHWNLSKKRK